MIEPKRQVSKWTELTFKVPARYVDIVSHFLVESLGRGVVIEEPKYLKKVGRIENPLTKDSQTINNFKNNDTIKVKAYLTSSELKNGILDELESLLKNIFKLHGQCLPPCDIKEIKEEDWAENWKQHFKPVQIGSKIIVKPSWEPVSVKNGQIVIEIDPSMAFGTGDHPTTRMIIETMESMWDELLHRNPSPIVLDLGTGTGILAIVAAKLGVKRVLAIDIDEDAIRCAKENIEANNVARFITVSNTKDWDAKDTYDVIVANLDLNTLTSLSNKIVYSLKRGGFLLLSGILNEQIEKILDAYQQLGLECLCVKIDPFEKEWAEIVFELPE